MDTHADTPTAPTATPAIDAAATAADARPQAKPSLRLVLGTIAFVAAGGMAGSLVLGGPPTAQAAAQPPAAATAAATPTAAQAAAPDAHAPAAGASGITDEAGQPDPELMVARLAERMKKTPDPEGLAMLGRAYTVLGHEQEAVATYRQAVALSPKDSQVHAELGRAIGNANGRRFNDESERMLRRAVELDNNNVMAHALLGKLEVERNHRDLARSHWKQALSAMSPQHPFAEQLRGALAQLDHLPPAGAGAQADAPPAASPAAPAH